MTTTSLSMHSSPLPARRLIARFAVAEFVLAGFEIGIRSVALAIHRQAETARRRRLRRRSINELRGLSNRALTDIGLDRSTIVSTVLEREAALFGSAPK